MSLLVIGSNGFLGRAVTEVLRRQDGLKVYGTHRHRAAFSGSLAYDFWHDDLTPLSERTGADTVILIAAVEPDAQTLDSLGGPSIFSERVRPATWSISRATLSLTVQRETTGSRTSPRPSRLMGETSRCSSGPFAPPAKALVPSARATSTVFLLGPSTTDSSGHASASFPARSSITQRTYSRARWTSP